MMLRPLGDRVLIAPDVPSTETATGLRLVQSWRPEVSGVVVARGSGVPCQCGHHVESAVTVGDRVAFSWMAGQEVILNERRYLLLREPDLLAVLDADEPERVGRIDDP